MGRLPILYVDGMEIAEVWLPSHPSAPRSPKLRRCTNIRVPHMSPNVQSKPIARFVARKFGFMGANDIEAAQVDCIGESVNDINTAYQVLLFFSCT